MMPPEGDHKGPFKGRYLVMLPREPLRPRRGGSWVVRGGDACVALVPRCSPPSRATQASPPHIHPTPAFRGRYFVAAPRGPFRIRRGGGSGWGGRGRLRRPRSPLLPSFQGDASVPAPHPPHS